MKLTIKFTLLQKANVYAPEPLGIKDILIGDEKVVAIEDHIDPLQFPSCQCYNLDGAILCPGLIDQHVHLIGGGGEAGPHTRTPEVQISKLVEAGITTVVGLMGTDSITRHPESLLAKVYALNHEGVTAYMLTGAYTVPTPTITGSIQKDIAFLPPVIGVKTAISDHRSSAPAMEELCRMASDARVAGLLGGKAGITVFHMGNSAKALEPIEAILKYADVPITKLLPTHVNRDSALFKQAINFAKKGGYIDITSGISAQLGIQGAIKSSKAIEMALNQGVTLEHITMSSDGQGSMPEFNAKGELIGIGVSGFDSLWGETRDLVLKEKLPFQDAIRPVTATVADFLQIDSGRIQPGKKADLLILDAELNIQKVFAKGRCMVEDGQACAKGTFET